MLNPAAVKLAALACGFDLAGVCRAEVLEPERQRYLRWLDGGNQGSMAWLTREWAERATRPDTTLLETAVSVICVALSYGGEPAAPSPAGFGRLARYAQGPDYHEVVGARLQRLAAGIAEWGGESRAFVDTAPTMDKALAVRAGLGWQAKNTNLLNREHGSFLFLGGLVTDLELEPDTPMKDGCGKCRACVAACPTGALKGDYTIDARLCISYLTVEHRGPIPRELRRLIGDWVFGCDICQDVCPIVTARQDSDFPALRTDRLAYTRQLLSRSAASQ